MAGITEEPEIEIYEIAGNWAQASVRGATDIQAVSIQEPASRP